MNITIPAERQRWLGLAILCSAFFMVVLDVAIVNVALPSIQGDLDFSQGSLQWVVSAYALTFGGLLLLGGRAADVLGQQRTFVSGVAVFALASLLGGLAWTPTLLVTARALQGVGAASMTPAALSILMTEFPEGPQRNKALGVWGAVGASGGTIGLLIGGALTQTVGWRWIFLLNVPIGAVVIALTPALLAKRPPAASRRRFDLGGALSVTAGLSLLVYAVANAPAADWASVQTISLLLLSALILAAFVVVERHAPAPLLPFRLFRVGVVLGSNVASLLFGAAVFGTFFVITLYLQRVLGYSPLGAGLAWLALSVTALLASAAGAALVSRIGPRIPLVAGLSITTAGLWLLSRLPPDARYLNDVMPALALSGLGIGLAFVTLSIGALEGVHESDAGLASGLVNSTQQIGGALGVAILSTLALSTGFGDALLVAASFAAVGAVLAAYIVRVPKRAAKVPLDEPALREAA